MNEKIFRKLSGIDNLKGISLGRLIIGIIFIVYGFLILYLHIDDIWIKISIALAFWGLGLMFILDGQSVLREYFGEKQIRKLDSYNPKIEDKKLSKIDWNKIKINVLGIFLLLILILFILIGINFYLNQPENKLIFSLIIIACSGGIGGTLYSIRGFYQNIGEGNFNFNSWVWWYIFRPIMSAVIGVFVYFLIVGGLLSVGNVSEINYSKGLMFYSAVAFLAGFSFTQFANKLEELASTIFTKKEDKKK